MKPYEFKTFKEYFEYQFKQSNSSNIKKQKVTLVEFAKKIGYSSASSLSMILNGDRLPSKALLKALSIEWKLSKQDFERLQLKVEIEKRKLKDKDSSLLVTQFNKLTPFKTIDLRNYKLINDWYVLVVKILAECPDFIEDPQFISQKLRRKITASQAKKALQLLQDTNLLYRDPETQKLKARFTQTETTHDLISEAIRNNHKGQIRQALQALDEQKIDQRQYNSVTLQFNSKKMQEAKTKILEFVKNFNQEFGDEHSNQVYQLNVQFFEHSNKGSQNEN